MSEDTWKCAGCGETARPAAAYNEATGERDPEGKPAFPVRCDYCHAYREWDEAFPFTIGALKSYANRHGSHFFDRRTMGFFSSRIAPGLKYDDARVYFITSEQDRAGFGELGAAWNGERRYTVRYMSAGAEFFEVGKYGEHDNLRAARAALKAHLAGGGQ